MGFLTSPEMLYFTLYPSQESGFKDCTTRGVGFLLEDWMEEPCGIFSAQSASLLRSKLKTFSSTKNIEDLTYLSPSLWVLVTPTTVSFRQSQAQGGLSWKEATWDEALGHLPCGFPKGHMLETGWGLISETKRRHLVLVFPTGDQHQLLTLSYACEIGGSESEDENFPPVK